MASVSVVDENDCDFEGATGVEDSDVDDDEDTLRDSREVNADALFDAASSELFPQSLRSFTFHNMHVSRLSSSSSPFASRAEVLNNCSSVDTTKPYVFAVHSVEVSQCDYPSQRTCPGKFCTDDWYHPIDGEYQKALQGIRDSVKNVRSGWYMPRAGGFQAPVDDVLYDRRYVTDPDAVPWTATQCRVLAHGVDPHGRTVTAIISGFRPFCIVSLTELDVALDEANVFGNHLCRTLEDMMKLGKRCIAHKVVALHKFRFWWSSPEDVTKRAKFPHLVLKFPNSECCARAGQLMKDGPVSVRVPGRGIQPVMLKCEEYNVEPHTKWYNVSKTERRGWCVVEANTYEVVAPGAPRRTFSQVELCCSQDHIQGMQDSAYASLKAAEGPGNLIPAVNDMPPELWRSSDIETVNPSCDGGHPDALQSDHAVFMISDVFAWMGRVPPVLYDAGHKDVDVRDAPRCETFDYSARMSKLHDDERRCREVARQKRREDRQRRREIRQHRRHERKAKLESGRALSYDESLMQEIDRDEELASSGSEGEEKEESAAEKRNAVALKLIDHYVQAQSRSFCWPLGTSLPANARNDAAVWSTAQVNLAEETSALKQCGVPGVVAGKAFLRVLYVLGRCDPVPGTVVLSFDDEKDLLEAWRDVGRLMMPDVTTGWNWDKYDQPYMYRRAIKCKSMRFMRQGRMLSDVTRVWTARIASNAMGDNVVLQMAKGYCSFDLMPFIRSNYRFTNYKLKTVAQNLLNRSKIDVSYKYVNEAGAKRDARMLAVAGIYCVVDSELVLEIVQRTGASSTMTQFCRIMAVEAQEYSQRGQQVRVRNQMLDDCRSLGFVMDGLVRKRGFVDERGVRQLGEEETLYGCAPEDTSYEGGFVVDSALGFVDEPIVTLDFASLYPSIQQRYNICPSTMIPPNVPECTVQEWESRGLIVHRVKGTIGLHRFVQNEQGIMPRRLRVMFLGRKATKKLMAQAYEEGRDEDGRALNAKQNAQKFTMNSYYGTLAAVGGMLTMKEVADAITAMGRQLTKGAVDLVNREYRSLGWFVRAGDTDSIMVQMPPSDEAKAGGADVILSEAWQRGEMLTKRFNTEVFQEPIKYELEKTYIRAYFVARKKYATWQVEDSPTNKPALKARGLECERRDNPKYVRDAQKKILKLLLQKGDRRAALAAARAAVMKLASSTPPLDDLVIYKELKAGKGLGPPPAAHVACAFRMGHLARGGMPASGERIGYLISNKIDQRNGIPPEGYVAPLALLARNKARGGTYPTTNVTTYTQHLLGGKVRDVKRIDNVTLAKEAKKKTGIQQVNSSNIYLMVRTLEEVRENPKAHPLNVQYYIENQVKNPLWRVLPDAERALFLECVCDVLARAQGISSVGSVITMCGPGTDGGCELNSIGGGVVATATGHEVEARTIAIVRDSDTRSRTTRKRQHDHLSQLYVANAERDKTRRTIRSTKANGCTDSQKNVSSLHNPFGSFLSPPTGSKT